MTNREIEEHLKKYKKKMIIILIILILTLFAYLIQIFIKDHFKSFSEPIPIFNPNPK